MRLVILLTAILTANAHGVGDAVRITSPDHAQTFAFCEMVSHRFYVDRLAGELAARITFSNSPYADSNDPVTYESFDFRFPGVRFDSARRLFFARSSHGEVILVAHFGKGIACRGIDLAPGAKVYVVKDSGRVTLTLAATNYSRGGPSWVQTDNNLSLQNILIALFGELFPESQN
ncbi:MAG TPA: hypothetical protein VFQ78_04715 [Candidatus Udaeobacter sp.]|jgi:hypothetical protein|nr:hypothetical protein [Candidatus Udaeobacter sp.]